MQFNSMANEGSNKQGFATKLEATRFNIGLNHFPQVFIKVLGGGEIQMF
jgi:hypothetical protein